MTLIINPTASIIAQDTLMLQLKTDRGLHREKITDPCQLDGLYQLTCMEPPILEKFVSDCLQREDPSIKQILSQQLIIEKRQDHSESGKSSHLDAFGIMSFPGIIKSIDDVSWSFRDHVRIADETLPEKTRAAVEIWCRQLPYRLLDVDDPDKKDLHWIFPMSPANLFIRSIPFLRALDDSIKSIAKLEEMRLSRAYVYCGSPTDIYSTHMDSTVDTDVTAIYYPMRWYSHFGGELLFYDNEEPRWVHSIKANRLLWFNGSRPHRISPIGLSATSPRYSIVLRYT